MGRMVADNRFRRAICGFVGEVDLGTRNRRIYALLRGDIEFTTLLFLLTEVTMQRFDAAAVRLLAFEHHFTLGAAGGTAGGCPGAVASAGGLGSDGAIGFRIGSAVGGTTGGVVG